MSVANRPCSNTQAHILNTNQNMKPNKWGRGQNLEPNKWEVYVKQPNEHGEGRVVNVKQQNKRGRLSCVCEAAK